VASVIGFGSGFVVGFISHRSWTFGISRTKASPELFRFLVVNLFSLLANVCIIWAAVDILGFIPEIGQILALIGSAMTNFIGMKLWVFKQI
jgi:putative flippase GtrA